MKHQKNEEYAKFWSGFALGAGVCGVLAFALGTRQGRETLRKTMDYLEHIEGKPDQIHQLTSAMRSIAGAVMREAVVAVEHAVAEQIYQGALAAQDMKQHTAAAHTPARSNDPQIISPTDAKTSASMPAQSESQLSPSFQPDSSPQPAVPPEQAASSHPRSASPPVALPLSPATPTDGSILSVLDRMRNINSGKKIGARFFRKSKK